jgi:hypothetical protein
MENYEFSDALNSANDRADRLLQDKVDLQDWVNDLRSVNARLWVTVTLLLALIVGCLIAVAFS